MLLDLKIRDHITESDEHPNKAVEEVPASLSFMESDQEQEINLPADEHLPASMSSAESDQEQGTILAAN